MLDEDEEGRRRMGTQQRRMETREEGEEDLEVSDGADPVANGLDELGVDLLDGLANASLEDNQANWNLEEIRLDGGEKERMREEEPVRGNDPQGRSRRIRPRQGERR